MPKIKATEVKSPTSKTPRKTNSRKTMDSNATPKTPIRRTKISQAVCDDQCKVIEAVTPRRSTRHQQSASSATKNIEITPKTRIGKSNNKLSSTKKKADFFLSPEPQMPQKQMPKIGGEKKSAVKVRQTFFIESTIVSNDNDPKNATIANCDFKENFDEDNFAAGNSEETTTIATDTVDCYVDYTQQITTETKAITKTPSKKSRKTMHIVPQAEKDIENPSDINTINSKPSENSNGNYTPLKKSRRTMHVLSEPDSTLKEVDEKIKTNSETTSKHDTAQLSKTHAVTTVTKTPSKKSRRTMHVIQENLENVNNIATDENPKVMDEMVQTSKKRQTVSIDSLPENSKLNETISKNNSETSMEVNNKSPNISEELSNMKKVVPKPARQTIHVMPQSEAVLQNENDDFRRVSIHKMSTNEYPELLQDNNSTINLPAEENIQQENNSENKNERSLCDGVADEINGTFEMNKSLSGTPSKKDISNDKNTNNDLNLNANKDVTTTNATFESGLNATTSNDAIINSPINDNGQNTINDESRKISNRNSQTTEINDETNRTFEIDASIPSNSTFEMNTSSTPAKVVNLDSSTKAFCNQLDVSMKTFPSPICPTIDLTATPMPKIKNEINVIELLDTPSPSIPIVKPPSVSSILADQFKIKKIIESPMGGSISISKKTPKHQEKTPQKNNSNPSKKLLEQYKSNLSSIFSGSSESNKQPDNSTTAVKKTPKRLQKTPYKLDRLKKTPTKVDFYGDQKIIDKNLSIMKLTPNVLSSPLKGIRKRSFSVTEVEKKQRVRFHDNLENVQVIENSPNKSMLRKRTQSNAESSFSHSDKKKGMVPDFSAIHLKLQNKMESITDYESRKRKRHAELSASKGFLSRIPVLQPKVKPESSEPAAQKSLLNQFAAKIQQTSSIPTAAAALESSKVDDRLNKCKNMYKKTGTNNDTNLARSKMLKGVRLNRRFDLQMKYRNNLES